MLGCRNDFCNVWKTVRFPANCHHQAEQGKVEAVVFTKAFPEPKLCISVTGKSVICTSWGFLSSSSLLGTELKVLSPAALCQTCRVFPPNILLHTAVHRLSFEGTWRAGGTRSLCSMPHADYFYIMQTYMDRVLFRARATTLPSLLAIKQKAVHLVLEITHFFRDSSK